MKLRQRIEDFVNDKRADTSSAGYIIMLVLTIYVMAYTLPDAMVALSNATAYQGAGTAVINITTIVLPIMIIFAIVLKILPPEVKAKIGM